MYLLLTWQMSSPIQKTSLLFWLVEKAMRCQLLRTCVHLVVVSEDPVIKIGDIKLSDTEYYHYLLTVDHNYIRVDLYDTTRLFH